MTVIIDYGVGNIGSIANMLKKVNEESVITSNIETVKNARRLILCGIGAFDDGMSKLEAMGVIDILKQKVHEDKTPILGICLGMQLFTEGSEEGTKQGLGFVKGFTRKFNFSNITDERLLRIPHMGWNHVKQIKPSRLLENMQDDPRFYFVHSYHVVLDDPHDELLQTEYGVQVTSAFEHENIIGVQFHPEKSHKFGMRIYENFVRYY